jgi:hypothetical protein
MFSFMCWIKLFVFCILVAVICELSFASARQSYHTSAMKRADRRAIGTECQGCGKMFGTMYAYDQHRSSCYLRGTACYAMPDENRISITAAPRTNISTAASERRPAKRTRGRGRWRHISHIFQIKHVQHIASISKRAYPRICLFIFFMILHKGGVYIVCILVIFVIFFLGGGGILCIFNI